MIRKETFYQMVDNMIAGSTDNNKKLSATSTFHMSSRFNETTKIAVRYKSN